MWIRRSKVYNCHDFRSNLESVTQRKLPSSQVRPSRLHPPNHPQSHTSTRSVGSGPFLKRRDAPAQIRDKPWLLRLKKLSTPDETRTGADTRRLIHRIRSRMVPPRRPTPPPGNNRLRHRPLHRWPRRPKPSTDHFLRIKDRSYHHPLFWPSSSPSRRPNSSSSVTVSSSHLSIRNASTRSFSI